MKIVIKIPEEEYNLIKMKSESNIGGVSSEAERVIAKGILLPKNHGRLIDADKVLDFMRDTFDMQELYLPIHFKELVIDEIPTIVDAEVENESQDKSK